jgi:alpha-galactosidase/6-phospho-beta-glucosidase family protein
MERNIYAYKTGDRSSLLWGTLQSHQTRSYDQAVAVLEDIMAMPGDEELNDYFNYPAGAELLLAKHNAG